MNSPYSALCDALRDSIPTPGAMTSGFAVKSIHVGPRELNAAMASSLRRAVPLWVLAPTVRTHGALPGAVMPPNCVSPSALRPRLPAEATTTIPACAARRAAIVSGSSKYDSVAAAATYRLMTGML